MEKNNYLGNLPKRNYELKKRSEERLYKYVLDGLRNVEYNTDNQILRNFKDKFRELMIEKIVRGYDLNNYFDIRNVLTQFPENLIIDLHDELIELINKTDSENIIKMYSLVKVYFFPFLSSRVKTENGYIRQTRNVNISDIYQSIIAVDREMDAFISSFINNLITSSEMNLDELKIVRDMLNEGVTESYYTKFNERFDVFKKCDISVFNELYAIHYNRLHLKLISRVNKEINKQGLHEQKSKDKEYTSYASTFVLRNEKEKRNHWYRH